MNLSFHQSGESGVLAIAGEVGIEFASELKSGLLDALQTVTSLEVDLAEVTSAGLCCLQLFCSAHRAAVQSGKSLALNNISEGFAGCMADAGFLRHEGCLNGAGVECLWLE